MAIMEVDPRQLRHLLAVSRAGSFVKAAESLHISQPALSASIARLEDVVGTRLVERGRHGARLNAAGEILTRHARSIETVLATAYREVAAQGRGIAGPLSIGGTPLATASIIPRAVAALTGEGRSTIEIVEGVDEELIARLLRHELDVVISNIGLTDSGPEVTAIPLFHARVVVVVRPGHPLAARRQVSLLDLADAVWVLPPQGGAFRMQVEALFTTSGRPFPTNLVQAAPFSVLKELVRQSDAVTVLSDQIVGSELSDGLLVAIPLKEKVAARLFGIHVLRERGLSPLASRFIAIARQLAPAFEIGAEAPRQAMMPK